MRLFKPYRSTDFILSQPPIACGRRTGYLSSFWTGKRLETLGLGSLLQFGFRRAEIRFFPTSAGRPAEKGWIPVVNTAMCQHSTFRKPTTTPGNLIAADILISWSLTTSHSNRFLFREAPGTSWAMNPWHSHIAIRPREPATVSFYPYRPVGLEFMLKEQVWRGRQENE